MPKSVDSLSRIFSALADPTRRDILARLHRRPTTAGELASNYAMSRPAISQHLKVLDDSGLITRTANAQWRECSIREAGLDDAAEWIEQQRAEWTERFDALDERLRARREERERS